MKFIINLYYALRVVVTPNCWTRNYNTSKELDGLINDMLDSGANIEIIDDYTTKLGGVIQWTSNFPYVYGSLHGDPYGLLPSRRPVFRLHEAVHNQVIKSLLK